jgi:hypothetical protein
MASKAVIRSKGVSAFRRATSWTTKEALGRLAARAAAVASTMAGSDAS